MFDRLFPFAVLAVIASILTGGFAIFSAPRATTLAAADSEQSNRPAVAGAVARPVPTSKLPTSKLPPSRLPPSGPQRTTTPGRSPVPLLPTRHTTYWGDGISPPATVAGRVVPGTEESNGPSNNGPSAVKAKAMIEADGYKSVKALAKAPDGAWRGLALRGSTEVAISVDTSGRVSAQ